MSALLLYDNLIVSILCIYKTLQSYCAK